MRLALLFAAGLLLASFAPPVEFAGLAVPQRSSLRFEAVPLDQSAPGRTRLGRLRYLGGWALTSNDPRFGGLSALHVEERRVTAVGDAGALMRFELPGGKPGLEIGSLVEAPQSSEKGDRDTESLIMAGGTAWIGFERSNMVARYRRSTWRQEAAAAPPAMRRWPENAGAEAMLRLRDGRFLVFSEGARRSDGSSEVLLFDGDPAVAGAKSASLGYRAPAGYSITDAAWLPDGRVLFLNRRFTVMEGVSAKLLLGTLPPLREGAVLTGKEIAHFAPPVTVDNMEALSVTRERGRTILWIASDDNFTPLQRTLLLKFELVR